jgi:hypothetical protein
MPLLPFWAFMACYRVNFTFYLFNIIREHYLKNRVEQDRVKQDRSVLVMLRHNAFLIAACHDSISITLESQATSRYSLFNARRFATEYWCV